MLLFKVYPFTFSTDGNTLKPVPMLKPVPSGLFLAKPFCQLKTLVVGGVKRIWCQNPMFVKDGRPYLFHSFRNKYFNKISLGNMLYFQNKL